MRRSLHTNSLCGGSDADDSCGGFYHGPALGTQNGPHSITDLHNAQSLVQPNRCNLVVSKLRVLRALKNSGCPILRAVCEGWGVCGVCAVTSQASRRIRGFSYLYFPATSGMCETGSPQVAEFGQPSPKDVLTELPLRPRLNRHSRVPRNPHPWSHSSRSAPRGRSRPHSSWK